MIDAAINALQVIINAVEAQSSNFVPTDAAHPFIADALEIIVLLNGGYRL